MALFTNLFHVGEVLSHLVVQRLALAPDDVVVGPPRDEVLDTKKHLRITLLWTSVQPTHRNDPSHRNPDGTRIPPPLSLTALYLFTTYGYTPTEESVGAHELLGDVMRALHDEPEIALPLGDLPDRGQGKLGVSLVPLTPELIEKLFGPLQIRHRPFAAYEVGPVQLRSLKEMLAARPVVVPGGVRLTGPTAGARPALQRVVPSTQGKGGRIRLDGVFPSAPTRVWIGKTEIKGAAIAVIDGSRSVSVEIPADPAAVPAGVHEVSLAVGDVPSEPRPIQVIAPTEATLDGPAALAHDRAQDLVLTGRALSGALDVVAWPDGAVQSPSEVVTLPLAAPASDARLTVASASLAALPARAYRFAARTGAHSFTPAVVLELTS